MKRSVDGLDQYLGMKLLKLEAENDSGQRRPEWWSCRFYVRRYATRSHLIGGDVPSLYGAPADSRYSSLMADNT